jgi:hypothetical protein
LVVLSKVEPPIQFLLLRQKVPFQKVPVGQSQVNVNIFHSFPPVHGSAFKQLNPFHLVLAGHSHNLVLGLNTLPKVQFKQPVPVQLVPTGHSHWLLATLRV